MDNLVMDFIMEIIFLLAKLQTKKMQILKKNHEIPPPIFWKANTLFILLRFQNQLNFQAKNAFNRAAF